MTKPLRFDVRMPQRVHVPLCNHLQLTMRSDADCAGDFQRTMAFLTTYYPDVDVDGAEAWLAEHGAHCDCEVVLNTVPWESIGPNAATTRH